jgi:uncharacterized RDD family membrane protein YckC
MTRFLAWFIDFLVIVGITFGLDWIVSWARLINPDFASSVGTVGFFVISFGYAMFLEWAWRGQTIGKRALHLRVVDAEGMKLQFDQIVTRNLLRLVDFLPLAYLVGGVACWMTRKCQRLGDIAANTIVVRIPEIAEPDAGQILEGKFNSLRKYPHLAARLRQRVTPVEASTALQAVMRRDRIEPAARVELFGQLAEHFRSKVDFPADAIEDVTDEQCVRNVIDVIYGGTWGQSPPSPRERR